MDQHNSRQAPDRTSIATPLLDRAGGALIAVATAGLCLAGSLLPDADGALLPPWPFPSLLKGLMAVALVSAIGVLLRPDLRFLWYAVGVIWTILLAASVGAALELSDISALVNPVEALVVTLAISVVGHWPPRSASRPTLVAACGCMLLLFGSIHLLHAALIASLIPNWLPVRATWPLVTGCTMLLAGCAVLLGRTRLPAAAVVAFMFLSWLPLVHAGRLVDAPRDVGEWRFALTALALAGALLIAAGRSPTASRLRWWEQRSRRASASAAPDAHAVPGR